MRGTARADPAPAIVQQVAEREGRELLRRVKAYREGRSMVDVDGKTVIRSMATPVRSEVPADDAAFDLVGAARFVFIGEASHGTHEFYAARGHLMRRLEESLRGKRVRPALAGSVEELFHEVGQTEFMVAFGGAPVAAEALCARAIGVIHIDETRALERIARCDAGELPETYRDAV